MRSFLFVLFMLALTQSSSQRPWMQGSIEYYCGRTQEVIDAMKRSDPGKADRIKLCECKHICDPEQEETNGRKWDAKCEARCNPDNCNCGHPCFNDV